MFINTSDLFILSLLAAALIFLLSYNGGFYSGFKEGYAKREKERLEFDKKQRISKRQISNG
jgi:hypothetical protein